MHRTLSIIALLIPLATHCQVNFPFPDSSAKWVHYYETMVSPPPLPTFEIQSTSNFCIPGPDTTIAGVSYSIIEICDSSYIGAIRSDSGVVHFIPRDSLQEFVLYDFSASVGDTVFNVFVDESLTTSQTFSFNPEVMDLVVNGIQWSPEGRKIMDMRRVLIGNSTIWYEGIGSQDGLFSFSALNVSNYWFGIECMSYLDTIRWGAISPGTCDTKYVGLEEINSAEDISVYPNPFDDFVHIRGLHGNAIIHVYNWQGQLLHEDIRITNEKTYDLSDQPSGLLWMIIQQENGRHVLQVLKE